MNGYRGSGRYEIKVSGRVPDVWQGRLGAMRCAFEGGADSESVLIGQVRDQAELSGILNTLYELRLALLSVRLIEPELTGDSLDEMD